MWKLDISSKKESSNERFQFISDILLLGKRIENQVPDFCSQILSAKIIRLSSKEEQKQINYFSENIKFINILIDTGTTNGESFLHFDPNFPDRFFPIENMPTINF